MIEVSHITKSFHGKKALNDVSFSIDKLEVVCIIGSMGSGKSTYHFIDGRRGNFCPLCRLPAGRDFGNLAGCEA